MILFLKLLLAHVIGDFCFQPDSWVADKKKYRYRSTRLYVHMLVHAVLLVLFLGFDTTYWIGFLTIVATHYLIDLAKLYVGDRKPALFFFLLDQALHIGVMAGVAHQYEPLELPLASGLSLHQWLFITALAVVLFVPAVIIKILIAQWRPETTDKQQDRLFKDEESLIKAGRFIGILERLFVFIFIVIDHWEAVGFLLAAKSIFRFGDLRQGKDRKLTEYVLIGTLLSFGSAILIGLGYLQLAAIFG